MSPGGIRLANGAASQAQQPVHREEEGKGPGDADREEGPHPEEGGEELEGTAAAAEESCPPHVEDRHDHRGQREDQVDQVPWFPSRQRQHGIEPGDGDEHPDIGADISGFNAENDIVGIMEGEQQDRDQGRDGQALLVFHGALSWSHAASGEYTYGVPIRVTATAGFSRQGARRRRTGGGALPVPRYVLRQFPAT